MQQVKLQGMDKIMEIVVKNTHLFINIELSHHFTVIVCILLGIDSHTFWIVSRGILHHSSYRTSCSCLTHDGRGNLLLTILSETDHSDLTIFKSGDCAGQRRCWSAYSCSSIQEWTLLAVCMGKLSSWKTASLSENNIWTIACTWLPKMSTQSLAVIRPFRVIIGPAQYQDIAAQIMTDPPPCFTVGTRHSGFQAPLGTLQT